MRDLKHSYTILLENIRLRPLYAEDLEQLRAWRNHDLIRINFKDKRLISAEQQKKWYQGYLEDTTDFFFIIEEIGRFNRPVGAVSLYNQHDNTAEFGRFIIEAGEVQGNGIGYKALLAIIQFSTNELQLNSIFLEVLKENVRAFNLYKKAGFVVCDHELNKGEQKTIRMVKQL